MITKSTKAPIRIRRFVIKKGELVKPKVQKPPQGFVSMYVHGLSGAGIEVSNFKSVNLISSIQAGLKFQELDALRESLGVPMQKLADKLGISKATLQRRKQEGRFHSAESDRLLRFARLMGKAVEVMETEDNARRWVNSPQVGLGGAIPLDFAETEVGAREVEDLLGRIEHGVYS